MRALLTELSVEPPRAADGGLPGYATAIVARLAELAVTRRITALKGRLQRINPLEETADYNRLFSELIALEQDKRVLREQAIGEL